MKKLLLICLASFTFNSFAQSTFGDPTYRVYLNVGNNKYAETDDLVILTLVGEKNQDNFELDNKELNDNNSGLSIFDLKITKILGDIEAIRLEVKKKKSKKTIDDLYVKSIKIKHLQNGKSTGSVTVNKWIGDGEGNGFGKSGGKINVSVTKLVDWD